MKVGVFNPHKQMGKTSIQNLSQLITLSHAGSSHHQQNSDFASSCLQLHTLLDSSAAVTCQSSVHHWNIGTHWSNGSTRISHTCPPLPHSTSVSTPISMCPYFQTFDQIFCTRMHDQSIKAKKCQRTILYLSSCKNSHFQLY